MMINSNATWPGYDMTRYDHEARSRAGTCRAATCCVWEGGGGGGTYGIVEYRLLPGEPNGLSPRYVPTYLPTTYLHVPIPLPICKL